MRVLGVAEWRRAGLTEARIRSLSRSGELVRVWHSVYATRSAVEWSRTSPARGHALRVMAATASVGRDSVASHQSAALIHGLDLFPAPRDLLTLTRTQARSSGRRKSDGIFFHTAQLPEGHVTKRLGVLVTAAPRTVVDLARVSSFMSGVVTADSALRAGLTTRDALLAVCEACAGWPGIRKARRVAGFADPGAESVLESCARVVFHDCGLEQPELQFAVTGPDFRYSVDFYWPTHRVIAEADGAVKYSDQRAAIRQLKRDQQLRDLGYKVIHFTWRELFQSPSAVITRIRKAFSSLSAV
jgi:Protein of unknown function (DUF559)